MDTTKTITHLSLCSGYEGIGTGLRRVFPNLREIAYVEREGFVAANLVAKMEEGKLDAAPVFTDVKIFPYAEFRGCVDILSGGFPCQPFSNAGKRQATEDPRHLFPFIRDGIRECRPRIVFLENVEGIISAKTGDGESVLKYVLRSLEEVGYRTTAGIFSASEVSAPHQRKRVFILGLADSERSGLRGGWSSKQCGDDLNGLQSNEGERDKLRSEAERCSRDLREELGNSDSQRCEGKRLRGDEGEPKGYVSGGSGQELGNASDLRCQQPSSDSRETGTDQGGEERGMYEPKGAGSLSRHGPQPQGSQEELADTEGSQSRFKTERQGRQDSSGGSQEELADTSSTRTQIGLSKSKQWKKGDAEEFDDRGRGDCWPARPSEPQHEWEEPRVTGQAEPELGGAANGASCRVDRLRLLGNGVVPATAAKAFVTLIQRLT